MRIFADEALAVATIWAEARSEPRSGQVAVAEVIRNRTRSRYSSDGTVASTVMRRKQFSCWNDSTEWREKILELDWESPEVQEARAAWMIAMEHDSDTVKGSVLYHTISPPAGALVWPPNWSKSPTAKLVAQIGRHVFYTDGGPR